MTENFFVIYCGPMWASKSTLLLRDVDRVKRKGQSVVVFKPSIDTRYSSTEVVTHDGERHEAISVSSGTEMLEKLMAADRIPSVVAVDEAFMIEGSAKVITWLFSQGVSVIVSSLDLSASLQPFSEIVAMMPYATRVEKLTAVCSMCSADARYTEKLVDVDSDDVGTEICVGGEDLYQARCSKCHSFFGGLGNG